MRLADSRSTMSSTSGRTSRTLVSCFVAWRSGANRGPMSTTDAATAATIRRFCGRLVAGVSQFAFQQVRQGILRRILYEGDRQPGIVRQVRAVLLSAAADLHADRCPRFPVADGERRRQTSRQWEPLSRSRSWKLDRHLSQNESAGVRSGDPERNPCHPFRSPGQSAFGLLLNKLNNQSG